jgi:hypothetical protein
MNEIDDDMLDKMIHAHEHLNDFVQSFNPNTIRKLLNEVYDFRALSRWTGPPPVHFTLEREGAIGEDDINTILQAYSGSRDSIALSGEFSVDELHAILYGLWRRRREYREQSQAENRRNREAKNNQTSKFPRYGKQTD